MKKNPLTAGVRIGSSLSSQKKRIFFGLMGLSVILVIMAVFVVLRHSSQEMNDSYSTPVWNWSLVDKTVVIDAGHGGIDPGAIGVTGIKEKEINLAVAMKIKEFLSQTGIQVVMIRETDCDFGTSLRPSQNKSEDLAYRTKVVEEAKADIILSIHCNSFSDKKQQGSQVFYYKGSDEGVALAKEIQKRLDKVTGHPRSVKSDDFYILRNTQGIALTVEIGFISSPEESLKLIDSDYQSNIAIGITLGVANYFEK